MMTFSQDDSISSNQDGSTELASNDEVKPHPNPNNPQADLPEIEPIRLLEEKLFVSRHKQKLGEVIVRKEVETKIIEVPIRREKLVVEKTGKNPEQLVEVIIGEGKVRGFKYDELEATNILHISKSDFLELETAQKLLEAIAQLSLTNKTKVRLEIVTNSPESQKKHQEVCDQFE